jgi:hypothetical protein
VYFGLVFTLPALAAGLELVGTVLARRPVRIGVIAWLGVLVMVVAVAGAQTHRSAKTQRGLVAGNKAHLVAAARLVESDAPLLRTMPMPELNPDIDVSSLEKESVRRALPDLVPGRRAALDVAAHLQVDVSGTGHALPPGNGLVWRGFAKPSRGAETAGSSDPVPACVERTALGGAVLEVPPSADGAEVTIAVSGNAIETSLMAGKMRSLLVTWPVKASQPVHVSSVAQGAILRIGVPPGKVTVCGP